jgi:hypothetical protein
VSGGNRTVEEWGERLSSGHAAHGWARACVIQFDRWLTSWRAAHQESGRPDWVEFRQAFVEGHFMVVAADHLAAALATGPHSDLLARLPEPRPNTEHPLDAGLRMAPATDGATYLRHVRNAHEHNDEDGRFAEAYGFGHGWHVGDLAGESGSIGGLPLPEFPAAVREIERILDERCSEADAEYHRLVREIRSAPDD